MTDKVASLVKEDSGNYKCIKRFKCIDVHVATIWGITVIMYSWIAIIPFALTLNEDGVRKGGLHNSPVQCSAQNSFKRIQQKHRNKTIFDQQIVNFVRKKSKPHEPTLYHLWFTRYKSNPLSHDCS